MNNLDGFDYVAYLKKHLMVGQIDPWRETDEGNKIYTLLVPIETAIEECKAWSNQEFSRSNFINYLKVNDVLTFKNVEEFAKMKEEKEEKKEIVFKKGFKKQISEERREKLRNQMVLINESKKASIS